MIATIKAIKPTMGLIGLFISSATLLLFRGEDTPGLAVFGLIRSWTVLARWEGLAKPNVGWNADFWRIVQQHAATVTGMSVPQHTYPERGRGFFRIEPDVKRRRAVLAKPAPVKKSHLKVV